MEYESVTHTVTELALDSRPSGQDLTVTVHRYIGGDGPTVYVQAAQHGIELNGPAVLRRLHDSLLTTDMAGTVVVVPVANPLAFDHRQYMTPAAYDALDPNLNRVWPGDEAGGFQDRLAAALWDLVTDADAAIDLHTGTADMLSHVRYQDGDGEARALATAFDTSYQLVDQDDAPADDEFRGTFRTAGSRAGIPVITAELANSRTVSHAAIETGAAGVRNVLRSVGCYRGEPDCSTDQTVLRREGPPVRAASSGLFEARSEIDVGDVVDPGDELGTIYSPSTFERRERVTADRGGIVYSIAREAVTIAGERLAGIATPVSGSCSSH